jgi:hypothetical protein
MEDRVVKPFLATSIDPPAFIKYLDTCHYDHVSNPLLKEFHELTLECQLKRFDAGLVPPNLRLYVCVSIVSGADNHSHRHEHPFRLKCSNSDVRIRSELLLRANANYSNSSSSNINNSFFFELNTATMTCRIADLYVLVRSMNEMEELFESLSVQKLLAQQQLNPSVPSSTADASIVSSGVLSRQSSVDSDSAADNATITTTVINTSSPSSQLLERVKIEKSHLGSLNTDLGTFRLKLQVVIHDLATNKAENYLTEPLYTAKITNGFKAAVSLPLTSKLNERMDEVATSLPQPQPLPPHQTNRITDSSVTNLNNLRILRSSRIYGKLSGGDEMFLLSTYFDPSDIEIEFFQFKNDTEIAWRKLVHLDRMSLHSNCALVFNTPACNMPAAASCLESVFGGGQEQPIATGAAVPASNGETTGGAAATVSSSPSNKIKVYYRLFRPSTKEYSDKWVFYYCKDDLYEFRLLFGDRVLEESRLFKRIVMQSSFSSSSPNRRDRDESSHCANDTSHHINAEM